MSYFLSHILYIVIAGVLIGFLAAAWMVLTEKNNAERDPEEEKPCDFGCESCMNISICRKEGKKDIFS